MRKNLAIILTLLVTITAWGQKFEGKITYLNTFKSKIPNLPDEKFSAMIGTKQEYYIKEGNYKSVTNGTFAQWQLYINTDNKLYNKRSNSETIFWNDASVNDDSVISFQLNKGAMDILGYKCDELIFTCKSGIEKYYFNTKLGVDTKLYTHHKFGNWYDYLKHTNALPLKMFIEVQSFSMESIATEVRPMRLDDKEFQLPQNARTEKSPN